MSGLNPKHLKALSLIGENTGLSTREIAKAVGFSTDHMRHLIEGHQSTGPVGQLFKTALNKTYDKISKRVKKNSKATQDTLIKKLRKWADDLPAYRMNESQVKKACDILHALSKATPKVEIGSISITKHMNSEELVNEFKRVTALARYALEGVRVSSTSKGGTGEVHRALAPRSRLSEESETPLLHPESETGEVS